MLGSRRSRLAGPIAWPQLAELLWHAAGSGRTGPPGRAGMELEWRASPSAGGLHPIRLVCIDAIAPGAREYDADGHAWRVLDVDGALVTGKNSGEVASVLGACRGCTVRMVADVAKTDAAYLRAGSLVARDAGCMLATLCLCAEWLGMSACPLGFLGTRMLPRLGYPVPRFQAVGGVQITG